MREILFRGKRVDNGKWVYGYYIKATHHWHGHGLHEDWIATDIIQNGGWCNVRGKYAVIPETVGQYTGLTDKNGKKIFEGDYWIDTDDDYLVYVVEFREAQFGFACYGWKGALMPYGWNDDAGGWGEIDFAPMTDFNIELIEIEGNIHDNPELLKAVKRNEEEP